MSNLITLNLLLVIAVVTDSARILAFFPFPSVSHQVVFQAVTIELAKRGHEVVVITTDPVFAKGKAPANYTEIDVHDISYGEWKIFFELSSKITINMSLYLKLAIEEVIIIFEKNIQTIEMQNILKDQAGKFDLLFIEACVRPSLAISHVLKVPIIQFSSFGALPGMYESVGASTQISLYPLPVRQKILNLTYLEMFSEYYSSYLVEKTFIDSEELENRELKRIFGADMPTIQELRSNVELIFLNINPLWDFNRPVPSNVIYLGGLHERPHKALPKDLQSYLDSSTNGVIYMSLGTNVKPFMLPRETLLIFLKVFATLPYNILWKWDQDELEGRPNNVNISKWLPQSDLLRHANVKLFITQGGLQSTDESITAGVPLIGIPMLLDQWYNSELYIHHKIGVKLDITTLTEEDLRVAINTVLKDDSYRANVVKLRNLIRDQPQSPLERAIWWTEYVLRNGDTRHLRSPAANITWEVYFEIELIAIILITLFTPLATIMFVKNVSYYFF